MWRESASPRSSWRWADLPVRWKGLAVIAAPIVPLLVTTVVVQAALGREARAQAAVAHSQRVHGGLQKALTLAVDAETAVRGYLLSGDDTFLDPFRSAQTDLPPLLDSIHTSVTDPWEHEQVAVVARLVDDRLSVLRGFVADRHTASVEALVESKRRMDGLRYAIQGVLEAEDRRLDADLQRLRTAARLALALVYGGAALGVAGGVLAVLLFTNGITRGVERLGINAERLANGEALLPVLGGDDEIGRVKRRLHDVAEQLKARDRTLQARVEQVAAANRELEAFSYSVSHDLRAPLRHVVGFSALLEKDTGPQLDDTGRRYIRTITEAAARMGRLIDDLLAFSRMAKSEMVRTDVSLDALVSDVVDEIRGAAADRDVAWIVHPLPTVRGDRAMLRVALVNLLSNALKYTGPRARAEIEIGSRIDKAGEVVVFVKDNGVGFDMTYADKLFGVFQRLHNADRFEGTGIGLASVRRIVQRHGGTAWAESQLDSGATFYVSLPAA